MSTYIVGVPRMCVHFSRSIARKLISALNAGLASTLVTPHVIVVKLPMTMPNV